MSRPKTSWEGPHIEKSPLEGLAEKNPPIEITAEARVAAKKRLEKALRPYLPRTYRGNAKLYLPKKY